MKIEKKIAFKSACRQRGCTGLRRTAMEVTEMPSFDCDAAKAFKNDIYTTLGTKTVDSVLLQPAVCGADRDGKRPLCVRAQAYRSHLLHSPIRIDWMLLGEISCL